MGSLSQVLKRVALGVEYDGRAYCGWERQRHCTAVQAVVEKALSRVAAHPVQVVCAGRTDSGVHALGQTVHFDTAASRPPHAWVLGANSYLPEDVSITWSRTVETDFHARFAALERRYRYVILNQPVRSALARGRATWERRPLEHRLMDEGGRALLGKHDFSAFRASGCQARTPVRDISHIAVSRANRWVVIDVTANAFLHHMVRNIAGVLLAVGRGEQGPGWVAEVLRGRDRRLAGVTAPPDGLYFMAVRYPDRFGVNVPEDQDGEGSLSHTSALWYSPLV